MSKLSRTHGGTPTGEAYDPARLEEAFGAFSERVRELEAVAAELRAELRSLRAERAGTTRFDEERWPAERRANLSPDWIAAVPPPQARRFAVPRIVLEGAFLLLVALCAGLADLSVAWIVLVMVSAWTLVVLSEWAAAAKQARWRLNEIAPPLEAAADTTGPWDMPVVEATVVDAGPDPESKTIVTTLPAEPAEPEEEHEPEQAPARPRRRGLWRRRRPAEAGAADPWEA